MSEIPEDINIRDILARIDRQQAETQKFVAEQHKLMAEGRKYNRDLWIVPFTVIGAIIAAIVARLPEILHAFGVGR
jgi:tetrahydromethanopterin S-methyltransferase subunit G